MSGIDGSGTSDEVPEEYAAVYRDAYLRALEEDLGFEAAPEGAADPGQLAPLPPAAAGLRLPLLVAAAVLVLIGAGFGLFKLLGSDDPATGGGTPVGSPSRSASTGTRPSSQPPSPTGEPGASLSTAEVWEGPVVPVPAGPVTASCTAKPGVDSAGSAVRYVAANTLDGDPTTAWRCDGQAIGETLTITLPTGTPVAEVGLIPGYAKTDPASGVDRYAENNRITRVRWTLADGVVVEQVLDPGPTNRGVQVIRVPRTATGSITLEVLAVKRGPRNTTAISEVEVRAAG